MIGNARSAILLEEEKLPTFTVEQGVAEGCTQFYFQCL